MNSAYLLSLDEALRELSPESGDEHVTDLAERVRAIIAREQQGQSEEGAKTEAEAAVMMSRERNEKASARHGFSSAESVDEQEETEKVQ